MLETYREKIDYDRAVNITHPQDCYPGNCPLVGYLRDGRLTYQEQAGRLPEIDPNTPDWNPKGCSRQCSYTDATYGDERIERPMLRTGPRGSGEFEPISWEEAFERIAGDMVDAMEENPQAIVNEMGPGEGGGSYTSFPFTMLTVLAGGINLDLESSSIQDFFVGLYQTMGKYQFASSPDESFNAELNLLWHGNYAYSAQQSYHFLTEARYRGSESILIAPDCSPTSVHADRYVPIEPATDAALALGMCRIVLEEGLMDRDFVVEQTDLPLLVREDTGRFLRESDLRADGREDQFYVWDRSQGPVKDPRDTLRLGGLDPALAGRFRMEVDGEPVMVRPVFERLRDRLADYTPDRVQTITGIHPEVTRELARKVATQRTHICNGAGLCKVFHGDLMERSILLLTALTGNWGRRGTGSIRGWTAMLEPTLAGRQAGTDPVIRDLVRARSDRELTDEEVDARGQMVMAELSGMMVPASFFYYRHAGYDEIWDRAPVETAGLPRGVPEYVEEALDRGWWDGVDLPPEDVEPSVMFFVANNALRNKAGTTGTLLDELWPKLDLIVTVDYRWSTTALYSDVVLPAAFHHEKEQFHTITAPELRTWSYADKAVDPVHDSRNELEIVLGIARAVERVAKRRGLTGYEVPHGITLDKLNRVVGLDGTPSGGLDEVPEDLAERLGKKRTYEGYFRRLLDGLGLDSSTPRETSGGPRLRDEDVEAMMEESVEDCVASGIFPEDVTLESIKEQGYVQQTGLGDTAYGLNTAADVDPDGTLTALEHHVEDKQVYPTLTGRAQFYLDHEWYLEADEALPRHKSPPDDHGGNREEYPFFLTSGHNRHGTHSITLTNPTQMNMHRGEPHVFISRSAAERKGVEDGDFVRVFNPYHEVTVQVKVSSQPADDQMVFYHAWDPYLFRGGKGMKDLVPGIVKPLHFAGGYGHLKYRPVNWQQQQINRHTCVDFEPVEAGGS